MKSRIGLFLHTVAFGLMFCGMYSVMRADDKASDPTGSWTWTVTRGGQEFKPVLKIKKEDGKLTGTITGRQDQENKIDKVEFKDGTLSFEVTREFNGQKVTQKYSGKLAGDTIKGKIESERNGEKTEREWEAKRAAK